MNIGINGGILCTDDPGGIARAGIELSKQLLKQADEVTIFSHEKAQSRLDDFPVDSFGYASPSRLFSLIWGQSILPFRGKMKDVDILYSPTPYCPKVPTSYPCVITVHDVSSIKDHSSGWYNRYEKIMLPLMISRADLVVTVSEFSKHEIQSTFDVSNLDICVVPNGVSDFFLRDDPSLETSKPLPPNYILYVGSFGERKNVSGLLESYNMLIDQYDIDHDLVLIGPEHDPTNKTDINPELLENINNRVIQLGYVSQKELKQAYISADLFAFPSLYEGFGIPPLEAMACGTPVVSSDRTAMPEVLGDAAMLCDPEDLNEFAEAMYTVLSNENIKNDMIRCGKQHSKKYTWKRSGEKLQVQLDKII
jgi:glycosyltransferase involved in cell wall biosynthesis